MKIGVKIAGIKYVNEIETYWSNEDYIELLKLFEFPDIEQISPNDLKEMLCMAITDFEAEEAAEVILTYKLSNQLNEGQIKTISHEMIEDKVAEEYPEPELHYDLFNINQLLFKAFNGTFPNTEASVLSIELLNDLPEQKEMTEEIMTKLIGHALVEKSIINKLYEDQLNGTEPFTDANKFIWLLTKRDNKNYELLTSRYWIEKEDLAHMEYECSVKFHEGEH